MRIRVPGMGSIMCLMIRAFMLALKNRMLFDQSVYLINTTTLVLIDFYLSVAMSLFRSKLEMLHK